MIRRLPLVLALFAVLATSGCGVAGLLEGDRAVVPDGGPGGPEGMSEGERAWAMRILDLVNAERMAVGLLPVAWDEDAARAAYAHSWDMDARNFFAHENPDGVDPGERLQDEGIRWSTYGENIARGYSGPDEVVAAWMDSEGHRENILYEGFQFLGIGIHSGPSEGPFWTQDFFR